MIHWQPAPDRARPMFLVAFIGRTNGWKTILNTLTIHYGDRITNHL